MKFLGYSSTVFIVTLFHLLSQNIPKVFGFATQSPSRLSSLSKIFQRHAPSQTKVTQEVTSVAVPKQKLKIQVGKLQDEHLDDVSTLLATATASHEKKRGGGGGLVNKWKLIKSKEAYRQLIWQRLLAMKEGMKVYQRARQKFNTYLDELDDDDERKVIMSKEDDAILTIMWDIGDFFRTQVEKALDMTAEPNVWDGHNFVLRPRDNSWLQHSMFIVKKCSDNNHNHNNNNNNVDDDDRVIAFCEVAMIQSEQNHDRYVPTIMNLVTSSNYRRQGVASRMVSTIVRYVQMNWKEENEIGLYVDIENKAAVALYKKMGFEIMDSDPSKPEPLRPDLVHMSKRLAQKKNSNKKEKKNTIIKMEEFVPMI